MCEHVFSFYIVWRPPISRIKLQSIAVSWVILFAWKGCKVHNTTQSLSNDKFLFWKYPLSGSDTTATSPRSTPQCWGHIADAHPLISRAVFHSQSWVIASKAGRQITWKAEVAKFSWGVLGVAGGQRLSCDTLVTKIDERVWCQKVKQIGLRAPSPTAQRGYIFYIQRENIPSWEILLVEKAARHHCVYPVREPGRVTSWQGVHTLAKCVTGEPCTCSFDVCKSYRGI